MSVSTLAADGAGLTYSGPWDDGYAAANQVRIPYGINSQVDFTATGTDLTMKWATTVTTGLVVQVSVDGGGFSTLALPGTANTFADVPLFSGLSDTAHTVTVRLSTGTVPAWYLNFATAFALTGASPTFALTSGFGPVYETNFFLGNGALEGAWDCVNPGGGINGTYKAPAAVQSGGRDAVIRFVSTATTLKIWTYQNGAKCRLYQDGAAAAALVTLPNTSLMGWVTIASGLDGASHSYLLAGTSNTLYLAQVMAVGGTLTTGVGWVRRGGLAVLGDSITEGLVGTTNDSTLSYGFKLAIAKNRALINGGITSTNLMSAVGGVTPGTSIRYTDCLRYQYLSSPPDYVLNLIGVNDINTASPPSTASFRQAYKNMLGRIRASVGPSCKIMALGILPTNATNAAANRTAYNAQISGSVSDLGDANTSYQTTDTLWGTGGSPPTSGQITANTTDGLHPNAAGYDALVSLLSPSIAVWSPSASRGIQVGC